VTALAFDPTGSRLISGGEDRKLRIWDLKTGRTVKTIDCDRVHMLAFNSVGDKLLAWFLTPGVNNQSASVAQVLDKNLSVLHQVAERQKKVTCLSFSRDGEWVALGADDGVVRIWDIAKNERPLGGDLPVHQKRVGDLAFTPDRSRLITSDEDGEVKIWDLEKKQALNTITAHKGQLLALAMSPQGDRFITVGVNGDLRLWSVKDGSSIKQWSLPTSIRNLIFTADGKQLITANGDTTLYLLDLPD
jgi:WD40 repeat protein